MSKLRFLLFFMCFLVTASAFAQRGVDKNVVAFWSFDEGEGNTVTDKANGLIGELGSVKWTDGKFGFALDFDGASSVKVPTNPVLDISEQITVEVWVYYPKEALSLDMVAVRKDEVYSLQKYLDGTIEGWVSIGGANAWQGVRGLNGNVGPVDAETWHHIAYTYDGSKVKVYIDGELDRENNVSGKIGIADTGDLYIGARNGTIEFMMGYIDEVRISNVARTQDEIKLSVQGYAPVSPADSMATVLGKIKVD